MAFPVDILDNCSHNELDNLAEDYLADLRCSDPNNPEYFSVGNGTEIPISLSAVGFMPLFGGDQLHKLLALFSPEDTMTAVAFYLADQWWGIDDIVRTSNPSREGVQQVRTLGERVVLYVLNRIIYRKQEMERNEVPFLCHSSKDHAKIFWSKGEAVGFFSVKRPGSKCPAYLNQSYLLPVVDTMFVRKRHHDKDFAVQMLEDFVDSFTEEEALGLRYPLSASMYTACKQYIEKYPGDHKLLWEVEGVGHWFQKTLISSMFQMETPRFSEASKSDSNLLCKEPCSELHQTEPERRDEISESETQPSEPCIATHVQVEPEATEGLEIAPEEHDLTPVSTRTRSGQLKRPKISRKQVEPEQEEASSFCYDQALKLESKEQIVENFTELIQQLAEDRDESDMAKLQEEISAKPVEDILQDNEEIQRIPVENGDDNQEMEPEPVNGAITKDDTEREDTADTNDIVPENMTKGMFQPHVVDTQEIEREALDVELNLDPGDMEEKSLTTLVSVDMDLEKSFDSLPEQVGNSDDLEMSSQETMQVDLEKSVIRQEEDFSVDSKEKSPEKGALIAENDPSGNGLSETGEVDSNEESSTSDTTEALDSSSLDKCTMNILTDTVPTLRQGPLLVVELQDVAFQPLSEGQRSQSSEQSEQSTAETEQSEQKSAEKGDESSSEEIEMEVPVVERRGLRRKVRAYKGSTKKRSKII
ncbi:hypothetical protein GDO86_002319 [Hymenochirus boettgeri]|uniref:Family with sequence similarity 169 member A n=1 Tax=Hymenochirus boettgeri TaxID=247094 RepID=A0A8T2KHY7_9PIPI|nr:hypothetical protein GDO86_002319 [Hymenochirus boettgeri]